MPLRFWNNMASLKTAWRLSERNGFDRGQSNGHSYYQKGAYNSGSTEAEFETDEDRSYCQVAQ